LITVNESCHFKELQKKTNQLSFVLLNSFRRPLNHPLTLPVPVVQSHSTFILKKVSMNKLLSVEFTHGLNSYYALVRVKQAEDWKEYFITILDGHLEEFIGRDIYLMEKDGRLMNVYDQTNESGKILTAISEAITRRLNETSTDPRNINSSQA
jgi:hypothetical protein